MTSGALVLVALGAIGLVIWYSLLQVLPAEGGADLVAVGEAWPESVR